MITKTLTKTLAVVAALGLLASAQALTITPATNPQISGNQTSQAQIDVAIAGTIGSATEIYKQNVGGSESGSFASSYKTDFFNSPSDPKDATITYVGGPAINSNPIYLLVKDGNQEPAWYLFTVAGWNGTETINLNEFWPNQGAISHVTIYGGGGTNVPDGGATAMLIGVGLLGLGALRRKA